MTERLCLVHYHEIGLKGKNRSTFENQLVTNLHRALRGFEVRNIQRISGYVVVESEDREASEAMAAAIRRVPGVARVSLAYKCGLDEQEFIAAAVRALGEAGDFHSFKVHARRSSTTYERHTLEMNQLVGSALCEAFPEKKVDVHNPDVTVVVHVVQGSTYVYAASAPGVGGLPVGTAGKVVTSKGNYGSEMLYTYEKYYDASDGSSLITTIDSTVQAYVEKNLQNAIDKYDIKNGAFCIVMDVNTGEIKAMATLGSYDPNNYLEIYDDAAAALLENERDAALSLPEASEAYKAAIEQYKQDVASARMAQWRNRCVSDGYEPGSTFKLITLASALDSGAVTLNDSFYCGGQEKFTGREQILNCWKSAGHGAQTTAQALGNSCNIAFGHIGLRMGGDTFYDYLKSFGVMEKTGVDLPGEASGLFYERKYLNDPANYGTSYLITSSFGQSFRITPMQLVRAVAAIVNGGYVLEPYIVSEVVDADGNTVEKNEKTVLRQVISQQTSEMMRTLMEQVVTEGTASAARTPGYRVGGKTGTSEKLDEYDEDGNQVKDKIVSFIGVAPIDDPQYAVLVALDTPAYSENSEKYTVHGMYISGGLMAAPTVRDIFLDILPYLGVEPDYGSEDIRGVNFTVPDVIGMDETEAGELLAEKTITYRVVGTGSVVTDQLPVAGSQVPGNSQIILYMGAEKQATRVEVPDFIGCSVADVNYLASNAGLYVQAKGTDRTDVYVLAAYQDIDPGTEVDRGTTITVEFSSTGASD